MSGRAVTVRLIEAEALEACTPDLAAILQACVADGASVGFVMPFDQAKAEAWWQNAVFPAVRQGGRVLWGAYVDQRLVGTVQLILDMMPNQSHRGEVAKMLVHPQWRRRGLARAMMQALLGRAQAEGRSLVTLDTRSGDPSQALYASCGFQLAGQIPGFALAPDGTDRRDATSYMYRLG